MHIYLNRMLTNIFLTFEILVLSFFIAVFNLAFPLYIMILLRKYVASGFEGTLITLTIGIVVIILFQIIFRQIRSRMAIALNLKKNNEVLTEYLDTILNLDSKFYNNFQIEKIVSSFSSRINEFQNIYNASNFLNIIDFPFVVIYILIIYIININLCYIVLFFIFLVTLYIFFNTYYSKYMGLYLKKIYENYSRKISYISRYNMDVKIFNHAAYLFKSLSKTILELDKFKKKINISKESYQTMSQAISMLMGVCIYAYGAKMVVDSQLNIASLIAINILASRSFASISKSLQSIVVILSSKNELQDLKLLDKVKKEIESTAIIDNFSGNIQVQNIDFAYSDKNISILNDVSFELKSGHILAVTGKSGAGKTSLAEILIGLKNPSRGKVVVDGINLQQVSFRWWRKQIIYMPEKLNFMNDTIANNIVNKDSMENENIDIKSILRISGLEKFINSTKEGLDTIIDNNGHNLPLLLKKQLAIARAFVFDGQIVILDEPTSGLDINEKYHIYNFMNYMHEMKKTIIIMTNDIKIIDAADKVIKLDSL